MAGAISPVSSARKRFGFHRQHIAPSNALVWSYILVAGAQKGKGQKKSYGEGEQDWERGASSRGERACLKWLTRSWGLREGMGRHRRVVEKGMFAVGSFLFYGAMKIGRGKVCGKDALLVVSDIQQRGRNRVMRGRYAVPRKLWVFASQEISV